jgi:hypothetical protein
MSHKAAVVRVLLSGQSEWTVKPCLQKQVPCAWAVVFQLLVQITPIQGGVHVHSVPWVCLSHCTASVRSAGSTMKRKYISQHLLALTKLLPAAFLIFLSRLLCLGLIGFPIILSEDVSP